MEINPCILFLYGCVIFLSFICSLAAIARVMRQIQKSCSTLVSRSFTFFFTGILLFLIYYGYTQLILLEFIPEEFTTHIQICILIFLVLPCGYLTYANIGFNGHANNNFWSWTSWKNGNLAKESICFPNPNLMLNPSESSEVIEKEDEEEEETKEESMNRNVDCETDDEEEEDEVTTEDDSEFTLGDERKDLNAVSWESDVEDDLSVSICEDDLNDINQNSNSILNPIPIPKSTTTDPDPDFKIIVPRIVEELVDDNKN